jgi:hypothetical protein
MKCVRQKLVVAIGMGLGLTAVGAQTAESQEPQFYPNNKYNSASVGQLQADIQACKNAAANYMSGQPGGQNAKRAARSAAKGAAAGALAGAITGQNVGRATGAGAAVGGAAGVLQGARERGANNPEYQKYATTCLEEKGYKVISWK